MKYNYQSTFEPQSHRGPSSCFKITTQMALRRWQKHHIQYLKSASQMRYKQVILQSFGFFKKFKVNEIKSSDIDLWIQDLAKKHKSNHTKRQSFHYELRLLRSFFNFCQEHFEEYEDKMPVRRRHFKNSLLAHKKAPSQPKNLSFDEFRIFKYQLLKITDDDPLADLAEIQYYHALRISEVTAMHWEDLFLNTLKPEKSFYRVQRHTRWISKEGGVIESGFKNSEAIGGFKDLPLFPQTYKIFLKLKRRSLKQKRKLHGLIFCDHKGRPFRYRKVQYAYDKAFRLAGLPYNATHILRHGGCRRLYEKTSDLEVAKQHLGNICLKSTLVYAKKSNEALSKAVLSEWRAR